MRGSFIFLDQTKENKFGGGEKEKREKKGKKKRKERKTKEMREKESARGKGRKMGKERKKEERKERAGRELSDFWCFDGRKSIGRELKLVYSTRATSRCQKQKEVGFSPTLVPPNLRVINSRVIQPQPWDRVFGH